MAEGESYGFLGTGQVRSQDWPRQEAIIWALLCAPSICGHLGQTSVEAWGLVSMAAICHLSLGERKAGQGL